MGVSGVRWGSVGVGMLRTRDTVSPCGQWWIKDLWYLFSVTCLFRLVISVQGVITIDLSSLGCIVPDILKKHKKIVLRGDITYLFQFCNYQFPETKKIINHLLRKEPQ